MKTERYGFTVQENMKKRIFTLIFYPHGIRPGEEFRYDSDESRESAFKHALDFGVAHTHNNIFYPEVMQGIENA